MRTAFLSFVAAALLTVSPVSANPVFFTTGDPDGLIATASRPGENKIEIETADDFILATQTRVTSATFTGLITGGATTGDVERVAIDFYRVFHNVSDVTRTINVVTRANSPGDVELVGRDTNDSDMSFTASVVSNNFSAANSVLNGIHTAPNQTTGGEGPVSGTEVRFNVSFTEPVNLPKDHYFFRPEVELKSGEFLWLSAARPIVAPGSPFAPDLQTWTRDTDIFPDWSRIGADIVGGATPPAFNASFSITGQTVPLPPAMWPGLASLAVVAVVARRMTVVRRRTAS